MYIQFLLLSVLHTQGGLGSFLKHINPDTGPQTQADAAAQVIAEYLEPANSQLFVITVDPTLPRNTFRLWKDSNASHLLIRGSSGVSVCRGFYYYIETYCNSHIAWDQSIQLNFFHNHLEASDLPNVDVTISADSYFIYYQNVCTWSYSFVWWGWNEWRRHIYWMALNGINLALAPFQELAWYELYHELGLTHEEIREHLSGPGFYSWQRMGNIRGWGGPASLAYMNKSSLLQEKIIRLTNDLGISLALPAFAGHVPVAFRRLYPESKFSVVNRWNRFEDRFCCPLFLEPTDPLFQTIGERFLRKTIDRYGTNHIYFADPFNEINPTSNDPAYITDVSRSIHNAMSRVDPQAVWLLQNWMWVKNSFWTTELIEAFLTAVPRGRILVLDLQSELFPQYERTNFYYGQPFIWCMLHNFGGTLDMHGSINILNHRIQYAYTLPNSTMVGVGLTPEGIFQNYVMYDFVLKQSWTIGPRNLELWFNKFAHRRYGYIDPFISSAVESLRTTVYAYKGLEKIRGKYTICRRPSLKIDSPSWYDFAEVEKAWENLLLSNGSSDLFNQDLVDVTRQALQNRGDQIYSVIIKAYTFQEFDAVRVMGEQFLDLLNDIDRILATQPNFLLGPWLEAAKSVATNEAERELFERNARAQITIWGPSGEIVDYANKQWSGIVHDFFKPRWTVFFKEMDKAMKRNRTVNERTLRKKMLINVEIPFVFDTKVYPIEPVGDSRIIAQELFNKWANNLYKL